MLTPPLFGMMLFTLGGFVGAVFPACFKKVSRWSHETYWLVFVIHGLFLVPLIYGIVTVPSFFGVLAQTPPMVLCRCIGFGAIWGCGSLCFGLTLRYLGVGLAIALVNGICAAVGTLLPPLVKGQGTTFFSDTSSMIMLASVFVMLTGIAVVGMAAACKDRELSEEEKKKAIPDYHFSKGLIVALIAGIASASMNFGLQAGDGIAVIATQMGTSEVWKGIPVMFLTMFGGSVTSIAWCLWQIRKNKTYTEYFDRSRPLWRNWLWAGLLPGLLWAIQPVSLKMGEPMMGNNAYVGFAIVMGMAFLFGTLMGILTGEWRGTGKKTSRLLFLGLSILILSAIFSGLAGYYKTDEIIRAF